MIHAKQLKIIKKSKLMHSNWYVTQYPDVAALGMDPAEHYLMYGAPMGRNPNKNFDTRFYLRNYPDAEASGLNPIVHYVLRGEGRPTRELSATGISKVSSLSTKLLSLGFTDRPLNELSEIESGDEDIKARAFASREIALWHMRRRTYDGWEEALSHLAKSRDRAPNLNFRRQLAVAEVLSSYFMGNLEAAKEFYDSAVLRGELSPDLLLASANLHETSEERLVIINRVLRHCRIPLIELKKRNDLPAFDRLTSKDNLSEIVNGPKVTVIIAAYNCSETLPTALRSLQQQTWKNLEIIIVDDFSPTDATVNVAEEFAERDSRIRILKMEKNRGAYVARNRGLQEATGEFVTLHDADDWSHPQKIEVQVKFMMSNLGVMACTSQSARCDEDMRFPRWAGASSTVAICRNNVSSLLVRHKPVFKEIGYWDGVRFGADSERISRIKASFGKNAVVNLETGPLSFQRISNNSIAGNDKFGFDGFFFGARREYLLAQRDHHKKSVFYKNPDISNFGVPSVMLPDRSIGKKHYDVIIASEFRMKGGSTRSNLEEIACQAAAGLRTGIVMLNRYDYPDKGVLPEVREAINLGLCDIITFGEDVSCDLLIIRYPPVLDNLTRYIPGIRAGSIRVIINQPPMSDYGEGAVRRYTLGRCEKNLAEYFGVNAVWHPIGPLVRDALFLHHSDELDDIVLSDVNWSNVIDIKGWDLGTRRRGSSDKLRIGRHSRDHVHKWPSCPDQVLAAYPDRSDVEIHVLGGGKTPRAVLGYVPKNWKVFEFGAMHPKDFLRDIDVWIYFAHPDWVESFGRTVIEAMAAGVPVVLPEVYRPVFGDSAIYATPETAIDVAFRLHGDAVAYEEHVLHAQEYVRKNFSYDVHISRVEDFLKRDGRSCEGGGISSLPTQIYLNENNLNEVAKGAEKVSSVSLTGLPVVDMSFSSFNLDEPTLLREKIGGHSFDYLWSPKAGAKRMFVLFSGDVKRGKNSPPVFQRWSWSSLFPGHCLYVSDPMIFMDPEIGLAWYSGTERLDPIEFIIRRIKAIAAQVRLSESSIIAYGSSGGGFAALRMSSMMNDISAVAINPQTNIAKFKWRSPDLYARVCLNRQDRYIALEDFPLRMDLLTHIENLKDRRIIIAQNRLDTHHLSEHFIPFCAKMGMPDSDNRTEGLFRRIIFEHKGGHGRAETPEVFSAIMKILESDF